MAKNLWHEYRTLEKYSHFQDKISKEQNNKKNDSSHCKDVLAHLHDNTICQGKCTRIIQTNLNIDNKKQTKCHCFATVICYGYLMKFRNFQVGQGLFNIHAFKVQVTLNLVEQLTALNSIKNEVFVSGKKLNASKDFE